MTQITGKDRAGGQTKTHKGKRLKHSDDMWRGRWEGCQWSYVERGTIDEGEVAWKHEGIFTFSGSFLINTINANPCDQYLHKGYPCIASFMAAPTLMFQPWSIHARDIRGESQKRYNIILLVSRIKQGICYITRLSYDRICTNARHKDGFMITVQIY